MPTAITTHPHLASPIPGHVIADYAIHAGISSAEAHFLARQLERFLYLCAHSQQRLVPSPAVDSIWHDFILHTRDYEAFCSVNFQRFIHHVPERSGTQALRGAYLSTIAALRAAFGTVDDAVWPHSDSFLNEVCNSCRDD